ncbi:hypothetical protein OJAV_G00012300 [Oryzias javanicus]|uniref:Uncharacterized protein n=1 Tax=Oryzias javanicus TaxID=123683 RepID=A0A3S2PLK1_ORYJA|nr:hypothetical protein OJAV_G00012300 [Oryzias javanicus]
MKAGTPGSKLENLQLLCWCGSLRPGRRAREAVLVLTSEPRVQLSSSEPDREHLPGVQNQALNRCRDDQTQTAPDRSPVLVHCGSEELR